MKQKHRCLLCVFFFCLGGGRGFVVSLHDSKWHQKRVFSWLIFVSKFVNWYWKISARFKWTLLFCFFFLFLAKIAKYKLLAWELTDPLISIKLPEFMQLKCCNFHTKPAQKQRKTKSKERDIFINGGEKVSVTWCTYLVMNMMKTRNPHTRNNCQQRDFVAVPL